MRLLLCLIVALLAPSVTLAFFSTTGQRPTFKILETIDDDVELKTVSSDRYLFTAFGRQKASEFSTMELIKMSAKFAAYLSNPFFIRNGMILLIKA